jgi:hypothetical protein
MADFSWLTPETFQQYGQFTPASGTPWGPIAQGAGTLASVLGQYLMGGEQRKTERLQREMMQWKFGKGKDMFAQLQNLLASGNAISPAAISQLLAQNNMANQPLRNTITQAAGRFSGMQSPETYRMMSQQMQPLQAGYSNQLGMMNQQMLQQLRQALMSSVF